MGQRVRYVLLAGPVPPPMHGAAYATQLLRDADLGPDLRILHLNTRFAADTADLGRLSAGKLVRMVVYWFQLVWLCLRYRPVWTVYPVAFYRGPFLKDAVLLSACWLTGVPVIGWFHMNILALDYARQPGWFRRLFDWMMRHGLRRRVLVGDALRTYFPAHLQTLQYDTVWNGIPDLPSGSPASEDGAVRLLYLSNMMRSKGWPLLLQAVAPLVRQHTNVELHLYGNPTADAPAEAIRAEIAALATDRIHYHGPVNGQAKLDALHGTSIFVFPTQYPPEAAPISLVEAMAASLPVVACNVGAIRDLVVDGHGGFVVPPTPQAISQAIEMLLQDASLRQRMGQFNRRQYLARHTLAAFADGWRTLLQADPSAPTA